MMILSIFKVIIRHSLFLFLALLWFSSQTWATSLVILDEGKEKYPLDRHVGVLEDQDNKWTIEDISSSQFSKLFVPVDKHKII